MTALAQFAAALEHLDYVIDRHDPSQQGSLTFGQHPKVVCLSQSAWTLWIYEYPDQALKRNAEAVMLAQKISHPYTLAAALSFASMVHQLNHDVSSAEKLAEAALKLSTEHEFAYWMAWGSIMRGWATSQRL